MAAQELMDVVEVFATFDAEIQKYYEACDPRPNTDKEKILALQRELGQTQFMAYGGGETESMELRAMEYAFLVMKGIVT